MALETERSSPSSASSPGPTATTCNSPSSSAGTPGTYTKSISPSQQQDIKPPLIHHPLALYPSTFQNAAAAMLLPQPRRLNLSPTRRENPAAVDQDLQLPLRFSVSNILRPEFGRRAVEECRLRAHIEAARSKSSRCSSADECRSFTSSPLLSSHQRPSSPRGKTESHLGEDSDRHSGRESSLGSSSRPSSALEEKLVDPSKAGSNGNSLWPAWVYCTRYSDRPSSGPRSRRIKKRERRPDEKRPRTAFTQEQLGRLKREFEENRYLTERRRQQLATELGLHENQIKIWFQNKRAKIKKSSGSKGGLALQLMAQGLYNHSTIPVDEEEELELAAAAAARAGAEAAAARGAPLPPGFDPLAR